MLPLHTAVLVAWSIMSPKGVLSVDADETAAAIETAVSAESKPFTTTPLRDAVTMAVYAYEETGVRQHPRCWSWDCKAGVSCGVWQMPCAFVRTHSLADQAVRWLDMMHSSKRACDLPGAILCGSCHHPLPRRMAVYRWVKGREITKRIEAMPEAG